MRHTRTVTEDHEHLILGRLPLLLLLLLLLMLLLLLLLAEGCSLIIYFEIVTRLLLI